MKKCLLLSVIALVTFSQASLSQVVDKGNKLFGGSFSFSVFNANNNGPGYYNSGNTSLIPSFAWAIKKDLTMGIKGSLGYGRTTNNNGVNKNTSTIVTVGPAVFLKKYKLLKNQFGVYFNQELNGYYSVTKQKITDTNINLKTKNESWGGGYAFQPGVFYKFSEHFLGEGNIGGLFASYFGGNGTHNYGIGASFLQNFNLGINYIIGRN